MKNDAFNLWTHKLKMKVYLLEKATGVKPGSVVTSFTSDTMKEWNNICGPRRDAVVLLKRGEIPH